MDYGVAKFAKYDFTVSNCNVLVVNFKVIENFYWQSVSRADVDMARVLLELLFVRLGNFHLFDFDTHALIVCLCTDYPVVVVCTCLFFCFFSVVVPSVRFHNKYIIPQFVYGTMSIGNCLRLSR